jgi:hypothetical protein
MGATGRSVGIKIISGHHFRNNLIALVIIIMLVSVPLIAAPPVLAAPAVGISATSGTPGSTIIISGTDFTVGDSYSIVFGPTTAYEQMLVSSTLITSGTTFSQIVVLPQAPWAQFTIRVETNHGNFLLPFQITPHIDMQISNGYVGDTLVFSGAGFRAGTAVNIIFNSTTIATTTSDTSGTLPSITVSVPPMRSGTYAVYGSDTLATSPSLFFALQTHLTASVIEGSVGDQITLNGSGFEYNSPLSFYWDGQIANNIQISSNSTGIFTTVFTVPPASRGNHSIKVVDNTARQANVIFAVRPSVVLSSASGVPGKGVSITGTGFHANINITVTFSGSTVTTQPTVITSDSTGGFTTTFIVPSVVAGTYAVRASDDINAVTSSLNISSTLEITPITGAVGATLQLTGSGFTPLGNIRINYDAQTIVTVTADTTGAFSTSFKIPASKAGAHVISATDMTSTGIVTSATFTMESTPPPKPTLILPPAGTQVTITPTLSWSAVTDPSGVTYNLQIARDTGFAQLVIDRQGITAGEYTVAQAEQLASTKSTSPYYWRVRAIDGAGNQSEWTTPGTFYTMDSTPPSLPLLLTPPNESQADVRPSFTWSAVDDPSGVSYNLQVAKDIGFTLLAIFKQGLKTPNYETAAAEQLELTKKISPYYWRVKAIDGAGNESAWTSPTTFYTQDSTPPAAPVTLKPEQGSNQGNQPSFSWTPSDDPSGVTYTLQISQDSAFSQIVAVKDGLQSSVYKLVKQEKLDSSSGSTPGVYYWRVMATDGAGNQSNWSGTNEFRVKNLLQSGWPVYIAIGVGGLLLLGVGIFIGMRLPHKTSEIT